MKFLKTVLLLLLWITCVNGQSDESDISAIRSIMEMQEKAWSNNDIEAFMEGYQKSDSIVYFGSGGIRRGYRPMLDSYKERYPTREHTGTLKFTLHNISRISDDAFWVMGEYHLTRKVGDANGTFMVIFKRIDGQWKIVADSSC